MSDIQDIQVDFSDASPVAVSSVDDLPFSFSAPTPLHVDIQYTLLSRTTTLFQKEWGNFIAGKWQTPAVCGKPSCLGCGGGASKRTLVQTMTNTTEWYLLTKLITSGFDSSSILEDIRYIVGKFHTLPVAKEVWEPATEYRYLHPEALGVIMFYSCQVKPTGEPSLPADSTLDNTLYSSIIDRSVRVRDLFATYLSGSSLTPDAALRTELFTLLYGLVPDVVTDSKAVAAATIPTVPDANIKMLMAALMGITPGTDSLSGLLGGGYDFTMPTK
jgi:hypothetical protein